jgi:hypothetical protein
MSCCEALSAPAPLSRTITQYPASGKVIVTTSTTILAINLKTSKTLNLQLAINVTPGTTVTIVNVSPSLVAIASWARSAEAQVSVPYLNSVTLYFINEYLGWAAATTQVLAPMLRFTGRRALSLTDDPVYTFSNGAMTQLKICNPTSANLNGWNLFAISIPVTPGYTTIPPADDQIQGWFITSTKAIPYTDTGTYPPRFPGPAPLPTINMGWCDDSYTFPSSAPLTFFYGDYPISILNSSSGAFTAAQIKLVQLHFQPVGVLPGAEPRWFNAYTTDVSDMNLSLTLIEEGLKGPIYGNYVPLTQTQDLTTPPTQGTYSTTPIYVNNFASEYEGSQVIALDFLTYCGNTFVVLSYSGYSSAAIPAWSLKGSNSPSMIGGAGVDEIQTLASSNSPASGLANTGNIIMFNPPLTNIAKDTVNEIDAFPINFTLQPQNSEVTWQAGGYCSNLIRDSKTNLNINLEATEYFGYATKNLSLCLPTIHVTSNETGNQIALATYTTENTVSFNPPTSAKQKNPGYGTYTNDTITSGDFSPDGPTYTQVGLITIVLRCIPEGTQALLFSFSWQQVCSRGDSPLCNDTVPFNVTTDALYDRYIPEHILLRQVEDGSGSRNSIYMLIDTDATEPGTLTVYFKANTVIANIINTVSFASASGGGTPEPSTNPKLVVQSIQFSRL